MLEIHLSRILLIVFRSQEQQGELGRAYTLYENALQMARNPLILMRDDEAAALNNMGGILIAQGNPGEALGYLLEAQDLLKDALTPGNALIHFNLGVAWSAMGNFSLALISYKAAKAMQEQFNDTTSLYTTYVAIGVNYQRDHDYVQAQIWLNDALHGQTESGDDLACANTLVVLARLKEALACPDAATAYYKQAEILLRPALAKATPASTLLTTQQWDQLAQNAGYTALSLH